jgi:hypothetical protein
MKPHHSRRDFLWAASAAASLASAAGPKTVVPIEYGGHKLLEYRCGREHPKTYIHPLCLADGTPLTLDGPPDHVHHRGLMAAWSEVNGVDFWGETNPARHGAIVHQGFDRLRTKMPAEIATSNYWVADGKILLTERRRILVPRPAADGVWLEWRSELTATEPVKLAAGEHVYNGLGIRFVHSMDGGGTLNSAGSTAIEKANGEPARWCAYYGKLDGPAASGGVALFDHPSNPRHPNAFFVMNKAFGYMSAAPTFRAPFELGRGSSIAFRWGVLAFPGEPRAGTLQQRFEDWTKERL